MDDGKKHDHLIRFSVFEIDLDSGELFKQGRKIKLQGQPFDLLVALLERPGELVTRDELQQKIWPSDTTVDFDRGLNRAMNKIREALGDSAESPHFIETLPRRGYRFIGSIQPEAETRPPNPAPSQPEVPEPSSNRRIPQRPRWMLGAFLLGLIAVAAVAWMTLGSRRSPEIKLQQLTTNSSENPVWHAVISPDGKYLAYGDLNGIQIRLISNGESHLLPRPAALAAGDAWFPAAWFPDGTRILAQSLQSTAKEQTVTAWTVSVIGGAAAPLRENALAQSATPDGSLIAFTTGSHLTSWGSAINRRLMLDAEIWVMGPHGENARKIAGGHELTYFGSVRWSPDGQRLAYRKLHSTGGIFWDQSIESCDQNGGTLSVIGSSRQLNFTPGVADDLSFPGDFWWLPAGDIIYAVPEPPPNARNSNLWRITVDSKSGTPRSKPRRVTNLAGFHMEGFSVTGDGTKLAFESSADQSQVYVGRLEAAGKLATPQRLTLDERNNIPFAWTPDSTAVIFNSDRTGTFSIYKQALEQHVPELIPTGGENIQVVRLGSDGTSLLYSALFPNESDAVRLMRVPLTGGPSQRVLSTIGNNFDCPHRAGAQCVASEVNAQGDLLFTGFDPRAGASHPLFQIHLVERRNIINWTISPDGSRIAMTGADTQGGVEIRSLAGQIETRIQVKGWPYPLAVDWASDGKRLFVSHTGLAASPSGPIGATLLAVDLDGNAQALWETRGGRYTWSIASPDGKYLAIRAPATERNAWMIENF